MADSTPHPDAPTEAPPRPSRAHRRLRAVLYLAFAALALAALAQGWNLLRLTGPHSVQAAAAERLQQHGLAARQIAQLAGSAATAPAGAADWALAALLAAQRDDGLAIDKLLGQAQAEDHPVPDRAALATALQGWHSARQLLAQRSAAPLHADAAADAVQPRSAAPLQASALAAADAAQQLGAALQAADAARGQVLREQVRLGVAATLALLLLLSLAVIEPTVRKLRLHALRRIDEAASRQRQQGKLQALWAVLPAGVLVHAADGQVVEANCAAERLMGLTQQQLLGNEARPAGWCLLREDGSHYSRADDPAMRTLASGQGLAGEVIGLQLPGGERRWLLANTEPQRDAAGSINGVVTCITDVTEGRSLQDLLRDSARTDALTRLPNRAVVVERLQHAIAHARRHPGYGFAVLFMDFDRFKQVNDTLGHGAGDELLRQIAQRLSQTLRPGDALARLQGDAAMASELGPVHPLQTAARLGGDEFVVVLEGVSDAVSVAAIAERLLRELAEPYQIGCTPVQSSASIGVVLSAQAGVALADDAAPALGTEAAAEDVLRNADTAMVEAKRTGRGRWVLFDDSMHERVARGLALETDLRNALKNDELFVVYQPVVDLPTLRSVGVEALVRWRHPTRGLVGPVEFIGVAEECGLIDALGAVVLDKACKQFMQWQHTLGDAAPRLLAVNLSRAQLERAGLVDDVRALLQRCGMAPPLLQLEVTESLAAQDERVQGTLRALKELGVRLALDDFGTGYSSLACLHQLPVDTVKIDRSFVKHAQTVEYHRVLIEATIRVARTLGMTTVAEGIETEGQAALMRALQCDRGQGYLFSPPLAARELERWIEERAGRTEADTVD